MTFTETSLRPQIRKDHARSVDVRRYRASVISRKSSGTRTVRTCTGRLSVPGLTESVDIQEVGKICNVDFLLIGNVDVEKIDYIRNFKGFGHARHYTLTRGVTARIVSVTSGKVVISITYSPRKPDVLMPVKVGDEIALAIKMN